MINYSSFLTVLVLCLNLYAAGEFFTDHQKGLPLIHNAQGKKTWDDLVTEFKKTGDSRLISLVLGSQPEAGIYHAEKAIHLFDMLKARPVDFMKSEEVKAINYACVFYYLIPPTRFIPFGDVEDAMSAKVSGKDDQKVSQFRLEAKKYHKKLSDPKVEVPSPCEVTASK